MRETQDTVVCPNCSESIPIAEALTHRIREEAERELKASKAALQDREREMKAELAKAKLVLDGQQAELAQAQAAMELQVAERVAAEKAALEAAAAAERATLQQEALAGLQLKAEYEAKQQQLELDIARRVAEERAVIQQQTQSQLHEEYARKAREKDQQLESMRRQVDELKRKAEQGSQQTQGEAFEVSLQESLGRAFPADQVAEVPKGVRGADLIQSVRSPHGRECGTILWEFKDTKAWNEKWVTKLKDDQRALKAELAVIVSTRRPDDGVLITEHQGVWVCAPRAALGVAAMLRTGLIQVSSARVVEEGKAGKAEVLYNYLASPAFQQRLEAIVEAFEQMRTDLEKERRAITAAWAKRETQIHRALEGAAGLYGDMQGLLGSNLPAVEALDLPAIEADETDDASAG